MAEQNKTVDTDRELVKEVVAYISDDINSRNGIGSAWRMINPGIKDELLDKWLNDLTRIVKAHREALGGKVVTK